MLPLKLTMQAFGAYPNKVEIPFEKLGASNIYLIAGVTGAGKTTIFDAICFALFNTSSTSHKGNATLRSHYAKETDVSFVEFEFLFNGKKYKVTRTPSYQRKKIRGEGYTFENSKAQILLPDSRIINNTKEVDEFIIDLLGLNIDQFSQIALLAQGEFLKLLNSDTQTRGEIFRNIFKTNNYLSFQLNLKDKFAKLKQEFELLKNSIIQLVSMLDVESADACELQWFYKEKDVLVNFDDFIEKIKLQNKNNKADITNLQKEISNFELICASKQKQLETIKNKLNLINQKDVLEQEITKFALQFEQTKQKYNTVDNQNKKLDELKLELEKTNNDFIKAKEIKTLEKELEEQENYLNTLNNSLNENNKTLLEEKNKHLSFVYSEYLNLKTELEKQKDAFLHFQDEILNRTSIYEKSYHTYLSNIAGFLALELKDKTPCPVCGSLEHPNKAQLNNEQITKEYVEELKNNLEKNKKLLDENAQHCSILKEKTDSKLKEFELLKDYYKIDFNKTTLKTTKKENFEENINTLKEQKEQTEKQISNLILLTSSTKTKAETLLKDLKNSDLNKILSNHDNLLSEIEKLANEIKNIQLLYEKEHIFYVGLNSKKELLDKQILDLKEIDTDIFEQIQNEINIILNDNSLLKQKSQKLNSKLSSNEKIFSQIKNSYNQYIELEKLYSNYKILSDCANGTLKGKSRLAFEQYIQGYYLDNVLCHANKILKIITKGQFQLLRKKDSQSYQGKTGLDLEVMDFHTFKKRDTKTLSGGESFKAALSLALGLSQCVSEFSGAINIDAMFIDEGFGSLDSESLELALDVIINLSVTSRLVGIISHVEELKTKIPNQIISIKTQNGSDVKLTF